MRRTREPRPCPICGRIATVGRLFERGHWYCEQCAVQFTTQGQVFVPGPEGELVPLSRRRDARVSPAHWEDARGAS